MAALALLIGGHAADLPGERLMGALCLTVVTGVGLAGLELAATAAWLLEVRGLAVLGKLALLLVVPVAWDHRVAILLTVLLLASVTAHMPGRLRHASVVSWWRASARAAASAGPRPAVAVKGDRS
jgi:hypothetical protein